MSRAALEKRALSGADALAQASIPAGVFGDFDAAHAFHSKLTAGHASHVKAMRGNHQTLTRVGDKAQNSAVMFETTEARNKSAVDASRMPDYPQLVYLSVPELIGAAGGDPWKIDDTIQAGTPGEISELARSFYNAGLSMTQTSDEFTAAKKRFDVAWDRDDPAHPINDSLEVQRATQVMRLNKEELTRVGVDLQNIATSLAEAQRNGHISIAGLNGRLVQIDDLIAAEIAKAQADGVQLDWSELKTAAIDAVKQRLGEMNAVRDAYGNQLTQSRIEMAAEGYDSNPIDGAVSDGTRTVQDQARVDANQYAANDRAADEALVNSPGPWTPEKHAAWRRLQDFATVMDPNANPEAVRYAGERLGDWNMSKFAGPLPVDPVLGRDARQRAKDRLEAQALMESGFNEVMAPMDPNMATAMLDWGDAELDSWPCRRRSTGW